MSKHEKFENILKIINRFDKSTYPVKINDLAEELGVNKKSVYRYIDTINQAGIPIDPVYDENGKPTGKYRFFNDFNMKKLKITNEEITLLVVLYEFTKKLKNKFNESFQSILNKVISESGKDFYYVKISNGMEISKNNPFIDDIEKAIQQKRKIRLKYLKLNDQKEFTYKIIPLKILFFDGFWYLAGITETNKYLIKYRIDNIKSLEVLEETFDDSINIKSLLDNSVNVFFPKERNITVRLKIDKQVSSYFKKKNIFPEQKIIKDNNDGLIIETKINQFIEIVHIICQWIPYISVIEPEEFQGELKEKLSNYLKKI